MQNATQKCIFTQCKHFATLYFCIATPFTCLPGSKAKYILVSGHGGKHFAEHFASKM